MDTETVSRRLRGAIGNAVAWGAGWAVLGAAAFTALKAAGVLPGSASWLDAVLVAARFGIVGGIVGGAFSGFVGLVYGGRRLSELSAVRFGVGGGLMAGVFVPAFLQAMNLLSGGGLVPMGLVLDDAPWAALFGGVAAGVTLTLAKRADPWLAGGNPHPSRLLASGDRGLPGNARDLRQGAPAWRGGDE